MAQVKTKKTKTEKKQTLVICNGNKLRLALDYLFFKMYDRKKIYD